MPQLEAYRRLAPFSARELLESANALLRGRQRLHISERTLRYYISQKVLPSPEGPPKIARYSFEHLVGLLAIRGLQDRGVSLDRIRDELAPLWTGNDRALQATIGVIDFWLASDFGAISEHSIVEAFQPFLVREEGPTPMPPAAASPPASYARRRHEETPLGEIRELTERVRGLQSEMRQMKSGQDEAHSYLQGDITIDRIDSVLQSDVDGLREQTQTALSEIHRAIRDLTLVVQDLAEQVRAMRSRPPEEDG